MRTLFAVLAAMLALSQPAAGALEPVSARASVDRQSITLGDPIVLSVQVEAEKGYQVTDPGVPRTIGDFDVLETLSALQTTAPGGLTRIIFRYRITSFVLGDLVLPPIDVRFTSPSGAEGIARTTELPIEVAGVIGKADDPTAIRPLRPPLALPGGPAYAIARGITLAAAAVLAVGALALTLRARRRVRVAAAEPARAGGPLAHRVLEDVAALARERLPEEGRFEEHYERLGSALRAYLGQRYGIRAAQRTAQELRTDLLRAGVERTQANFVFELLREGEVVRFRHTAPSPRHANDVATAAMDFLRRAASAEEYELAGGRPR